MTQRIICTPVTAFYLLKKYVVNKQKIKKYLKDKQNYNFFFFHTEQELLIDYTHFTYGVLYDCEHQMLP